MKTERPLIVVVGSSNTDLVARTVRLPGPGETVLGEGFAMLPGGKGANQAVAAARLGARVVFVARIGTDLFGDKALDGFAREGIDTRHVVRDPDLPSGVALIGVSSQTGENSIIVAGGSNGALSVDDVMSAAETIRGADILLCQLETPFETVEAALKIAREAGVITILNPAPAAYLSRSILEMVTVLTPNETEAFLLSGKSDISEACDELLRLGARTVIATLGSDGALIVDSSGQRRVTAALVKDVVDTTAAGDCFCGAVAVAIAEGRPMDEAVRFANAAAGISVTRQGAQPSLPTRSEVENVLFGSK